MTKQTSKPSNSPKAFDPKMLDLMVCPLTKTKLTYNKSMQELISKAAGLAYPIRQGIPLMLIDEARKLGPPDLKTTPKK